MAASNKSVPKRMRLQRDLRRRDAHLLFLRTLGVGISIISADRSVMRDSDVTLRETGEIGHIDGLAAYTSRLSFQVGKHWA